MENSTMPGYDQMPAAPPPPGVIPNFIDPPSQANMPRIFTYVTLPPMVLFVALRIYVRIFKTREMGLDDYLCTLSSVTFIIYTVLIFTILDNPSGPHLWDVPASKITAYFVRIAVLTPLLFLVAAMSAKTAILALYRRIFRPSPRSNTLILSGMAFTVLLYVSVLIVLAVACIPRPEEYAGEGWLSPRYNQRCNKYNPVTSAVAGVLGAVIDIYILILPLFFVSQLQTSRRRKAGLAAIFILGSLACVFSIVNAYYRIDLIVSLRNDMTWAAMPVYGLGIGEINVGIVCSCIPVAFVLFKWMAERSIAWANHFWFNFTGGYRTANGPSGATEGQMNQVQDNYDPNLPEVPKATMTGLRSILGRFGRTRLDETRTAMHTDDLNLTVRSVDYDYHKHLRAGSMDKRM